MKTYRHLFLDLDHTLWDFEKNDVNQLNGPHGSQLPDRAALDPAAGRANPSGVCVQLA